ncbi:hypothetical protein V1264_012678 [Littorina saxatilis]
MSSDDNLEENRIERRKKQKRDYARRKTQRTNRDLDCLASNCERLKDENNDMKQQIRDLQTWVKFAESFLTLCRHLHLRYPAPQPQPAGILGHSMTSEAGVTSSLLPTCDVGLSVHIASRTNDSVAWNATGGQVPNTNNLIQQMDPDCMLQHIWKISHTPTTGNLPTQDPTFSADSDSIGINESQVPNASNLVRTMDSDRQLENVWQPTHTPIAGPLPTPDPAFPVNANSMDMNENQVPHASNLVRTMDSDRQLENVWQPKHITTNGSLLTPDPIFPVDAEEMDLFDDHVVQDLLLVVQQDFDMQTALEELSQSLPLPVEARYGLSLKSN